MPGLSVFTVPQKGWSSTKNRGFDAFLTADQSIQYQQNLSASKLRIVVFEAPSNRMEHIGPLLPQAIAALREMQPGEVRTIQWRLGMGRPTGTIIPGLAKPTPADSFLDAFGHRIRAERAARGMSRKLLARHAGISERYIAQLESGKGNISILLLRKVATALGLPLVRLLEDEPPSPDMALVRHLLAQLAPPRLSQAYAALAAWLASDTAGLRTRPIALVRLPRAGENTLRAAAAQVREVPFFELDREIERLAGASIGVVLEMD